MYTEYTICLPGAEDRQSQKSIVSTISQHPSSTGKHEFDVMEIRHFSHVSHVRDLKAEVQEIEARTSLECLTPTNIPLLQLPPELRLLI